MLVVLGESGLILISYTGLLFYLNPLMSRCKRFSHEHRMQLVLWPVAVAPLVFHITRMTQGLMESSVLLSRCQYWLSVEQTYMLS